MNTKHYNKNNNHNIRGLHWCSAVLASALLAGCQFDKKDEQQSDQVEIGESFITYLEDQTVTHELADYVIQLSESGLVINWRENQTVFASLPNKPFLGASTGEIEYEIGRFHPVKEISVAPCEQQSVDALETIDDALILTGTISCSDDTVPYSLTFQVREGSALGFIAELDASAANSAGIVKTVLTGSSNANEGFFGFGAQYSYFNLKGRSLPIVVTEQGFGRGDPETEEVETIRPGVGGTWYDSYSGVPQFITTSNRGLYLDTTEYSVFDLSADEAFSVNLYASKLSGGFLAGQQPLDLIESYTAYSGRMRRLPDWANEGAILGVQGGTEIVRDKVGAAQSAGVPIGGVWMQDWSGQRVTPFGKRLWWNWTLDKVRYPGWNELVADWGAQGIRVLTYINPNLVNRDDLPEGARNLYTEAKELGYLAKDKNGDVYTWHSGQMRPVIVDITNPKAWDWYKQVIKDELIASGASGWMADFGEALPYDIVLHSGVDPTTYHNLYTVEWARMNREAIREAGLEDDIVIFHRSGYSQSPAYATLFWEGDQNVTWGRHDGIKSAVVGLVSSGVSGYSLNHSDIGGYTAFEAEDWSFTRSKELFMRWAELAAFTPVFRTHEGNRPEANHQFYSDEETANHFADMATLYSCFADYRSDLMTEAEEKGWPVARHPFLHYPSDSTLTSMHFEQFMLGEDVLVAPVMDEGEDSVGVYLPGDAPWTHFWSGEVFEPGSHNVSAPIGRPAAFIRSGSRLDREQLLGCATPEN